MSKYHSNPRDHSKWGHVLEHSPSIIHAATFGIHDNKAISPQRHHAQSQPESPPVHECTLPTSNARRLAHALRTGTKVNPSGVMLSCCICWKSCMVFSGCQALKLSLELFIPWKNVELQCPWSHCSQLCCHPWRFLWVIKPECLLCHLVLEIGKLHINQTRETQIKLWSSPCVQFSIAHAD